MSGPQHSECLDSSTPLVSLVIPAYNEAPTIERHLAEVVAYLERQPWSWELVLVNDGSSDATAELAEKLSARDPRIRIFHHTRNRGLGAALRTGFKQALGRYLICLDLDLSYSPDHLARLLQVRQATGAQVILASPYMPGGTVSHVPIVRRALSLAGNWFLHLVTRCRFSTFTGMVRLYDSSFIKPLALRADGSEINLEILLQAVSADVPLAEMPAHLDWTHREASRISFSGICRQVISVLRYGWLLAGASGQTARRAERCGA